jgi:hypothetical protein
MKLMGWLVLEDNNWKEVGTQIVAWWSYIEEDYLE